MLLFAAAAAVLVSYAYESHALGSIEDWTMNKRFAIRGAHTPTDVVIVAIDDRTLAALGSWPLPRRYHGDVIGAVSTGDPRAVAIDIQFTELSDPRDDNALINAVGAADSNVHRVVLAAIETDKQGRTNVFGGAASTVGARVGFTGYSPDPGGVLRDMPWGSATTWVDGSPAVPLENFALVSAEVATGRPIPRSRFGGSTPIDYVGPPGTVDTYSYYDVLRGRVGSTAFTGKVVVIGGTATALEDEHTTPYGAADPMSGPEVEANAIETALHGFPLRPSRTRALLLIVVFSFLVPVASLFLRWRWCLLIAAVAAVLLLVAAQVAFDHGVAVVVAWPLVALALGTLAAGFLRPGRGRVWSPASR
jgi:CHASE2 domain-containing sensor protein